MNGRLVWVMVLVACTTAPQALPVWTARSPIDTANVAPTTVFSMVTSTTTAMQVELSPSSSVRVVLVGDVMLGRGVAPIARRDPEGLFEGIRYVVASADIAGGNLESPLTFRPHVASNPNDLSADPVSAALLAAAGFDLMSVANNHSGDAGRESVADTVTALTQVGVVAVGGGSDLADARATRVLEHDGIRLAFLAFDATRAGWPAGPSSAGIAHWDDEAVLAAVAGARREADVVVVSVHGGIEYLLDTDPGMADLADRLVDWGADVVWGHGPHVIQPVYLEGATVVATSLGNFIFDQRRAITETGLVLEVLADRGGVVAYRLGRVSHPDRRVRFDGWDLPAGNAVLLDGEWWTPVRMVSITRPDRPSLDAFHLGKVTDASVGDITGDGLGELVVSYRHDARPHLVREAFPERSWVDRAGLTAHLGVFSLQDHTPLWAGGALFRPVVEVVACDGAVAVAFDALDDPTVVAVSAWTWNGFGFDVPEELPGAGTLGCADVDGDRRTDPVILNRR